MILDGHVKGNKMIDMQLKNSKLNKRARKILIDELSISDKEADKLIKKYKSVRLAIENYKNE